MSAPIEPVAEKAKDELDTLADRNADSTDSDVRYMAYGARLRTALRAGQRYIAYVRFRRALQRRTAHSDRFTPDQ